MIFVSVFLSGLSLLVLYFSIFALKVFENSIYQKTSELTGSAPDVIPHHILAALVVVGIIWNHGIMESLSDFLFQSFTILWYFNNKKYGPNPENPDGGYSSCCSNFYPSLRYAFRHLGTIIFGSIYAFIPDSCNFMMNTCQNCAPCCYTVCCCVQDCCCRSLSRYSYIETIMQSEYFTSANTVFFEFRRRVKSTIIELYMMGNFYMTLAKILIVMLGIIHCYFMMLTLNPSLFDKIMNILPPLIVK